MKNELEVLKEKVNTLKSMVRAFEEREEISRGLKEAQRERIDYLEGVLGLNNQGGTGNTKIIKLR